MPREFFGRSPGNGVTMPNLSVEPLATEGEATAGPDDYNPYDEEETVRELAAIAEMRARERDLETRRRDGPSLPSFDESAGDEPDPQPLW